MPSLVVAIWQTLGRVFAIAGNGIISDYPVIGSCSQTCAVKEAMVGAW